MFGHVLVPERGDLRLAVLLCLPLGNERLVDEVDSLHEERAGAGGGIEDLYKILSRRDGVGDAQALAALGHLPPRRGVREAILQPELSAK